MEWTQAISQWRDLTPAEKLRHRWEAIPLDMAQSMAYEWEPVALSTLQEIHARTEPPGISKPPVVSSPIAPLSGAGRGLKHDDVDQPANSEHWAHAIERRVDAIE